MPKGWDKVKSAFAAAGKWVKGAAESTWKVVKNVTNTVYNDVKSVAKFAGNTITSIKDTGTNMLYIAGAGVLAIIAFALFNPGKTENMVTSVASAAKPFGR